MTDVRRFLAVAVVVFAAVTVFGVVALWPPRPQTRPDQLGGNVKLVDATITTTHPEACPGVPEGTPSPCRYLEARITSGVDRGNRIRIEVTEGPDQPALHPGDRVVLGRGVDPQGVTYYFADYQRRVPLLLLGIVFAVLVVALGRLKGAAALVGLAASLLVLIRFVLPGILAGESPVAVALVGSALIIVAVVYLAHGVNVRTTTALLGTLVSLAVTGLLAALFVSVARITGLSSEEATYLKTATSHVSVQGLVLAGVVIGSLGVLNDVTVTQASAVWEIHLANPTAGAGRVYQSAMRVGRDHIASTVYTLVLAYAGASLPLLVLFTLAGRGVSDVITGEVVAQEVVRTLVGGIGLVSSVPITTGLAALVVAGHHGDDG